MSAPRQIKIDFVSDVVCPWCAIGLTALEQGRKRFVESFDEVVLNPLNLVIMKSP